MNADRARANSPSCCRLFCWIDKSLSISTLKFSVQDLEKSAAQAVATCKHGVTQSLSVVNTRSREQYKVAPGDWVHSRCFKHHSRASRCLGYNDKLDPHTRGNWLKAKITNDLLYFQLRQVEQIKL